MALENRRKEPVCFLRTPEDQEMLPLFWPPLAAVANVEKRSPRELGGRLLARLEPLLVRLQGQDVLLLQLPLGRTVAQLDGQRVFPQHLQGQRACGPHPSP